MSHTCLYSPVAEHHRLLAVTHFAVPRRVEARITDLICFVMRPRSTSGGRKVNTFLLLLLLLPPRNSSN